MTLPRPCLNCGEVSATGSRCPACERGREARRSIGRSHYRGDYQTRSRQIRENASVCWICGGGDRGTSDPFTADHLLPGDPASPLLAAHRSCNSRRGNGERGSRSNRPRQTGEPWRPDRASRREGMAIDRLDRPSRPGKAARGDRDRSVRPNKAARGDGGRLDRSTDSTNRSPRGDGGRLDRARRRGR